MAADLDAAIRAKLADRPVFATAELPGERARDANGWMSAAAGALLAVLDLHKPMEVWCVGEPVCTCLPDSDDPYMAHAYPCPTKRAIAKALGIEESND